MHLTLNESLLNELLPLKNKLFRVAKRLLVSKEEAEDATQEILYRLWNMEEAQRAKFNNLEAYSITMIKNYCLDRLKSKQVQQTVSGELPKLPYPLHLAKLLNLKMRING